jgi:hypothetical protein
LPLPLSDTLRTLRARRLVDATIGVAPCFDGDVDCVSVASALLWAKGHGAETVVCGIGPGIVGTGTPYGHGGLAVADAANTASALRGSAVIAPRVSNRDERERHRGVSHHTRAAVRLCLGELQIAWPADLVGSDWDERVTAVDVEGWQQRCASLPLQHMGRGPADDPWFFAAAYAAGAVARDLASAHRPGGEEGRAGGDGLADPREARPAGEVER